MMQTMYAEVYIYCTFTSALPSRSLESRVPTSHAYICILGLIILPAHLWSVEVDHNTWIKADKLHRVQRNYTHNKADPQKKNANGAASTIIHKDVGKKPKVNLSDLWQIKDWVAHLDCKIIM